MKIQTKLVLTLAFVLLTGTNVFAQKNLIEIFDGRESFSQFDKPNDDEAKFFSQEIKKRENAVKADFKPHLPADCEGLVFLQTVVEGAFTKPFAKQKAYIYEGRCEKITLSRRATAVMIAENDQVIFNRFYSTENILKVKVLPDINRNGLSEIVFVATFNFGAVMDYNQTWLDIIEYSPDKFLKNLGSAVTHWWAGLARDPKNNTANYKIFVKPSAKPTFYRETYQRDKDQKWILTTNLEKFTLTAEKDKFTA